MKLMILTSMMMSMIFMKSSHPVMLMFVILTQTIILCLLIWLTTKMNWFSYILFLIFLGGLMVLFVYISSLASNEMFNLNIKSSISTSLALGGIMALAMMSLNTQSLGRKSHSPYESFAEIYSSSMLMPSATTMVYLLLTLVVVVKMTSKYEGPLRSLIFSS